MKVLYIIDTLEGYGAEKSLVSIANSLAGVEVVFVHIYKGDTLKPELETNGIKVYSLDIDLGTGFKYAREKIIPIIQLEKPDIIHSTLFRAELVTRGLKKIFPEVLLVSSFVSNSYGPGRYRSLSFLSRFKLFTTQLRDRWSIRHVDYFICNSHAIKSTNIKALGVSENKVKVIHRGRSFDNTEMSTKEFYSLKKSLGIEKQKIFLNVGRLQKGKGQMDLIFAFKAFLNFHPDSLLFIVGEGHFRQKLELQITNLGLGKNVFLLGYRDDVPNLLHIADYFIFPSFFEGLPGALIEAIISRTPCIVSNIKENLECFPEDGALSFTPGKIDKLTEQMLEAIKLRDWLERTELSYCYATHKFDIKKISRQYESFYSEILRNSFKKV